MSIQLIIILTFICTTIIILGVITYLQELLKGKLKYPFLSLLCYMFWPISLVYLLVFFLIIYIMDKKKKR